MIALLTCFMVWSQEFSKDLNLKAAGKKYIILENVNGSVEVEGYSGNEVRVTGKLRIKGESERDLEKGKKEFDIAFATRNDTLLLYNKAPFINNAFSEKRNWGTNWNEIGYYFHADLKVIVPQDAILKVSTINNGDVYVNNVTGKLKATNVNGSIYLEKVKQVTKATTVNGNIDITFTSQPATDGKFKTVNGDVTLFTDLLSSTVEFQAMHGDLYSEFEYENVGPVFNRVNKSGKRGATYKVESSTKIKIGEGKHNITFKSINGNMYIKKI